tara:strand:- start:65719 stop:66756 length:1038 start_codon:yes stop_codon:yes gene_type:complete
MTHNKSKPFITNRGVIALIRAKLDAEGHSDVAVSRQWIDEDTPGEPFLLNVPLGTELFVPLRAMEGFFNIQDQEDADWHASLFAQALVNLQKATKMLLTYAAKVKKEALAQVAAARADGLDIQFSGISFKSTYVRALSGMDWKEAAFGVLAEVSIRNTSFHLQPEVSSFCVEEAVDVADEMADLLKDQRERQQRLEELERAGFDLTVDQITIDLLEAHELDVTQTLRRAWKKQCVNRKITFGEQEGTVSIHTSDGVVGSSLQLGELCWNGEYAWFHGEKGEQDLRGLLGKTLAGLTSHPVFCALPITNIVHHDAGVRDLFYFDMSQVRTFDADSGDLGEEQRLAA